MHDRGIQGEVWGHDLDAAYRQLPVRNPHRCHVVLQLGHGVSLWRRNALSFGSTASVWSFNRWADSLQMIARRILHIPVRHFVDDFAGIEDRALAGSGFQAFRDFFTELGITTKTKKEQPPQARRRLLGVILHTHHDGVELCPCPDRAGKVVAWIDRALQDRVLSPMMAQRLAGKIAFLASTMFGQFGKAALQPIYARGSNLKGDGPGHFGLTDALATALSCLRRISSNF